MHLRYGTRIAAGAGAIRAMEPIRAAWLRRRDHAARAQECSAHVSGRACRAMTLAAHGRPSVERAEWDRRNRGGRQGEWDGRAPSEVVARTKTEGEPGVDGG